MAQAPFNIPVKAAFMTNEFPFCVFLVDDDPFCRQLYEYHLKKIGIKDIYVFENGDDCINSLVLEPDLIFLDHYMKPITGLDVMEEIKSHNPEIFVVIVSGQEEVLLPVIAMETGAFDYIVKSDVTEQRLLEVIEKVKSIKKMPK
jgi:DNA-binding NtrC family response regulator